MSYYYPLIPLEEYWVKLNILDIRPDVYEISNYGNVRRIEDKFPIKAQILLSDYGAYRIVNLVNTTTRKPKKYLVHRLVGMIFVPNPNNYPQINHINNNGMDECDINLEWCTPEYNTDYQQTIGSMVLSNLDNYAIYQMIENGMSNKDIVSHISNPLLDEMYVEDIRQSYIRNNPVSEYNMENRVVNSSRFSNEFTMKVCGLFESGMTPKDYKDIADIMGVELKDYKAQDTFRMYCSNLYKRKHHTHISKNYNW